MDDSDRRHGPGRGSHWRPARPVNRLPRPAGTRPAPGPAHPDDKGVPMAEVHGTCEPRFEAVRATLADQIDTGADIGASVAVFLHGEPVVDLWGGWADEAK